jgi:hypothetical protein
MDPTDIVPDSLPRMDRSCIDIEVSILAGVLNNMGIIPVYSGKGCVKKDKCKVPWFVIITTSAKLDFLKKKIEAWNLMESQRLNPERRWIISDEGIEELIGKVTLRCARNSYPNLKLLVPEQRDEDLNHNRLDDLWVQTKELATFIKPSK